jgi:eukaryotic-like serine/threonine-protein kinase
MKIEITLTKKAKIKLAAYTFLGLAFLYILFNWTMAAIIHSRKEVKVPDLAGRSLTECVSLVSPLNLGLRKEGEEINEKVPEGTVIWQSPPAGMNVREGKIIKVTVSKGGKVVFIPDVAGQPIRTAQINIRAAGLMLGEETTKYSLKFEKDLVISQDPKAGEVSEKDVMVNLIVSEGQPPAGTKLMPDWTTKNIFEAKKWAEENRLTYEIVTQKVAAGSLPGTILNQDPQPDTDITTLKRVVFTVVEPEAGQAFSGKLFNYDIPNTGTQRMIKLTMIDQNGEHELFKGTKMPGSKLSIPIDPFGKARVRIFMNGILVEERDVN